MKGMIGMSEMTLQECIARLEDLIQDRKSFFSKDGNDDVFRTDAAALEKAVSMLRKIAAGEYKQVVHCKDCALLDHSPCPARDPESGATKNCVGYCGCGVPMGKDDSCVPTT